MSKIKNLKKFGKEFSENNKDAISQSMWLWEHYTDYLDDEHFIEAICKHLMDEKGKSLVMPDGLYETKNCKFSIRKGMLNYNVERQVNNFYIKCNYFEGVLHGNYYEYKDPEHKILLRIKVYKDGELIEERENKWKHLNFPHGKVFFKVEETDILNNYATPKEYKLWYFHDWIWQPVPSLYDNENIIQDYISTNEDEIWEFMQMYKNPDKFIEYLNTVYSYA